MTPLQQAAQDIVERWDSPGWKDVMPTAGYIAALRKALTAEIAQSVEPVAWIGDDGELHRDKPHEAYGPEPTPLYLHPPQQVAVPQKCKKIHVTEAMHRAAVKVLHRAPGVAGLPQRMMDAMLEAQGEKP